MATVSGIPIHLGTQARALTAALVLGTAILGLAPGQTAYAARGITNEAGDTESGGGAPGRPATVKRQKKDDKVVYCSITGPDGHVDLYLPGEFVVRGDHVLECGKDGEWVVLGPPPPSTEGTAPGGGVYTQAP